LYLEYKFGIPLGEDIVQGKGTIDRLEDQRQDILREKQQLSTECAVYKRAFPMASNRITPIEVLSPLLHILQRWSGNPVGIFLIMKM
jgi:hypothetical protein